MCTLLPFLVCFSLSLEAEGKQAAPAPPRHIMIYHEPGPVRRLAGEPRHLVLGR